ncbi:MAG: hypothetical protein ACLBM6_08290 [Cuspidothrix sp.]
MANATLCQRLRSPIGAKGKSKYKYYSQFPIPYSLFPITDSQFPIPYSQFPIPYYQ